MYEAYGARIDCTVISSVASTCSFNATRKPCQVFSLSMYVSNNIDDFVG